MIHGEVENQPTTPSGQLASRLRGKVYQPDCDDYHRSRTVWNGGIDRKPALIAHCAGVFILCEHAKRRRAGVFDDCGRVGISQALANELHHVLALYFGEIRPGCILGHRAIFKCLDGSLPE